MPLPQEPPGGERLSLILTAIAGFCILVVGGIALYFTWQNQKELRGVPLVAPPTAVPTPVPTPMPTPYVHAEGFSLTPPLGWVEGTANDPTLKAGFIHPVADTEGEASVAAFVTVTVKNTPSTTLGAAAQRARRDFSTLPRFTLIDDAQVHTISGEPAHIVGGSYQQKSSSAQPRTRDVRSKSLILVHAGKTYMVTGTALASAWEPKNYNTLFDATLTSLTVPGSTPSSSAPSPAR
ncbi:MAG: LpqN/LpqT family lipoprotein [bacterium]|nr:LpqN/LpqT family lipoprotein [bacterium]